MGVGVRGGGGVGEGLGWGGVINLSTAVGFGGGVISIAVGMSVVSCTVATEVLRHVGQVWQAEWVKIKNTPVPRSKNHVSRNVLTPLAIYIMNS